MDRRAAPTDELIDALASGLEAGLSPADCLSTIARAGAATARLARQMEDGMRGGALAPALTSVLSLAKKESVALVIGEEAGKLAAALRWVVARRAARRVRRWAIASVSITPVLIGVVTLLLEPLPAMVMGTGSFVPMLRGLVIASLAVVAVAIALQRMPARLAARIPVVRGFATLSADAETASLIGAFADGETLGAAPRAVRAVVDEARASALERAGTEPRTALTGISESLALVVAVGQRTAEISSRAHAFEAAASTKLTARLRMLARVLAWIFALAATVHATRLVMQMQLPSIGGLNGAGIDSPELNELMKELDNAGK